MGGDPHHSVRQVGPGGNGIGGLRMRKIGRIGYMGRVGTPREGVEDPSEGLKAKGPSKD